LGGEAVAQTSAGQAFARLDKNGDGKLTRDEAPSAESFAAADANQDGSVTPDEFRRYLTNRNRPAPQGPAPTTVAVPTPQPVNGVPALKQLADSDAVRDAAGVGQLFECVHVPGLTDIRKGVNGFAIADLNRDGRPDFVATVSPPVSLPGVAGTTTGNVQRSRRLTAIDQLVVFLNEDGFRFREHRIEIRGSTLTPERFEGRAQVPNLADFNGDGFLDLFITRHASMQANENRGNVPLLGNTFLLSDGAWDRFVDLSDKMGTRNERAFFSQPMSEAHRRWRPLGGTRSQPGMPSRHPLENRPYYADAVSGDFDNDGWLDFVVLDRRESPNLPTRSMLWMNRGDGTFEPKPTTFSGLDSSGISGEAADLNGDGLLDLFIAADPDNTGVALDIARYESKVYWNTGEHGGKQNHWLHLTFTGLKDAELIGARVELTAAGKQQYRWIHSNHSYKSGGALDVHFGLGTATQADVKVTLLSGETKIFPGILAGKAHELRLAQP
jgi:hypothetical protein